MNANDKQREFRRWFSELHQAEVAQYAAAILQGKLVRLRWDAQARKIVTEVVESTRCQMRLSGVVCGRLLTDPCGYCAAYDKRKVDWARVFADISDSRPRGCANGGKRFGSICTHDSYFP